MSRLVMALCMVASITFAQEFRFTVASPVASQDFRSKMAAFVFRTEGCADPAKSQISGTAEGVVKGERRSVPLKVEAMSKPGVYAVYQNWPAEGTWLVNLKGVCSAANAGAVIPIGPKGFIRETSKFFPRPATAAEVEASLKALTQGGNQ